MAEVKVVQANGSTVTVESTSVPVINVSSPSVGVVKVVGGVISFETATIPNAPGGGLDDQYLTSDGTTAYWDYVENIFLEVKNDSGVSLAAGTPVYAKGVDGNTITVGAADAVSSSYMPAIGLLYDSLDNGATGHAITAGLFNKTISGLSGVSVGDTVFVASGGGVTTTKPVNPALIQNIGVVLKTNGSNIQKMKVSAIDRVNDVPNLSEGKFFIGSAANTVASSYTVPTSIGTSGQVLQSDGTNVVFADNEVSATDISTLHASTYVIIQSSTGTDDTINPANSTDAGVMTASDKNKLDSLKFYDTVADMIADDGLSNGDLVRTAGYLSYGDGGGLKYEVKNTGTPTSGTIIDLTGGLYAHAFMPDTVNPIMFGAKVDDNDTAVATANTTALNGMFAYMGSIVGANNSSISCEFTAGTMYINGEVKMPMGTGSQPIRDAIFIIDFNGARVIGLDTGTPYTMFSRKKTDLDLAYYGEIVSSNGDDYLQHKYEIRNGFISGPNRTDGTTLIQIQCTYGSIVRNMKFSNAHTALTMQFCLMALIEQNMYNAVDYGSILSTGSGYWTGASQINSQSNASIIRQERHYCTTTAVAGISVLASGGCRVEQCIVEGGACDHALIYDAGASSVVKDFLIDNFWLEVENLSGNDGVRKSAFVLKPSGGLVTMKGLYAQKAYTCFNNSTNSWTNITGGTEGEYTLTQSGGDLSASGSGAGLTIVVNVNSSGVISSWRLGGLSGDTSGFVDGEVITILAGKLGPSSTAATITVKARDLYESGETGAVGEIKAGIPLIDTTGTNGYGAFDLGTSWKIVGHKIKSSGAACYLYFDGLDGGDGGWPDKIVTEGVHNTTIPVNDDYWLAYGAAGSRAVYPWYRYGKSFRDGRSNHIAGTAVTNAVEGGTAELMAINAAEDTDNGSSYKSKFRAHADYAEIIGRLYTQISTRNIGTSTDTERFRVSSTRVWVHDAYFQVGDDTNGYTLPSTKGSDGQVLMQVGDGTPAGLQFQDITQATGNELENIVEDTTPQLGGDLDVNGNAITAASGDITMSTGASNVVDITTNYLNLKGILGGRISFYEATSVGSDFVTLSAPVSVATPVTLFLPNTSGSAGQVLGNSGSGVMTWVDPGVDVSGTPSDNQLAVWTDADTIEGDSNLTWDGSELAVTGQKLYPSTTGSNQFYGDIVDFGSGPAGVDGDIALGNIYYLDSSQQWELADADAVATSSGMLGLAIADDSTKMLVKGFARSTAFASLTTGAPLYLSTTAGGLTITAPSATGDVVRVVGYCTNATDREIYFDPSKDWIELS